MTAAACDGRDSASARSAEVSSEDGRQRLLADHVTARLQHATRLLEVVRVGRGDVDDPDPLVGQEFVEVAIDPRDPQPAGHALGAVGRGAEQADHLDADPAQRLDVHRPDEAPADHGGPRRTAQSRVVNP